MGIVTSSAEPPLVPVAPSACVVCGEAGSREVASAAEIEAQRRYLRRFHRRRLRRRDASSMEERAEFTQDYVARIVACIGCGLVYRDPQPSRETIARDYKRDSYAQERLRALFESQLELFRPKVRKLGGLIPAARPVVFEIGSFVGGFLAACSEAEWDAVGIDPGEEVAAFCEARGLHVLRENVADVELPRGAADCIAIWNTFDQLPDPAPALRAASSGLKAGGLVVVRVPNGRSFERCMQWLGRAPKALHGPVLAAMAWNNLLTFPYLHGYSVATLDRLFAEHGFERIDLEADVLTRLSDERTKAWATWEERAIKAAWKSVARLATASGREECGPWLDVYYRRLQT